VEVHSVRSSETQAKRTKAAGARPLIDIATVAEWLGVGERHVRRLISERRIPYVKWGHYVRFDSAQIDEWLRTNEVPPMRALSRELVKGGSHDRRPSLAPTLESAMDDGDESEHAPKVAE
jgi:excisionase family DNA binding protein